MTIEFKGLEQLTQAIIVAGQATIDRVGAGRGNSAKNLYKDTLAAILVTIFENKANLPLVVVEGWDVEHDIDGVVVPEKPIALMLAVPIDADGKPIALPSRSTTGKGPAQITVESFEDIAPPDAKLEPLLAIELNTSSQSKPFTKATIINIQAKAKHAGARTFCLLNFGHNKVRSFAPSFSGKPQGEPTLAHVSTRASKDSALAPKEHSHPGEVTLDDDDVVGLGAHTQTK